MKQKTRDMTQGKPAGIIVSFAIPLMLGNVFQQMYTVMDSVIVGRGVGVEALAALGTSDWLSFTAMGGITGIAQGFSVLIAQYFGAKEGHCYVCVDRCRRYISFNGFIFRKSDQITAASARAG